jgi:hypothetical protein
MIQISEITISGVAPIAGLVVLKPEGNERKSMDLHK